jgi:hypothetical protein
MEQLLHAGVQHLPQHVRRRFGHACPLRGEPGGLVAAARLDVVGNEERAAEVVEAGWPMVW